MMLTPKNWSEFQHYKDRSPAWIKLHRKLLDDYDFHCLPVASRALAPLLWLLASEYENGIITATSQELAYRLRMNEGELLTAIKPLIDSGFFITDENASGLLAECKHGACLEKEKEKEKEGECANARHSAKKDRRRATQLPDGLTVDYEKATSAGLSRAEAEREFTKFKNHARERGRTSTDWQAAWHNWCLKACEFMGRKPPEDKPGTPAIPGEFAVKMFKETSRWNIAYGPEPGKPGCRAPDELLEKFGYGKSRTGDGYQQPAARC